MKELDQHIDKTDISIAEKLKHGSLTVPSSLSSITFEKSFQALDNKTAPPSPINKLGSWLKSNISWLIPTTIVIIETPFLFFLLHERNTNKQIDSTKIEISSKKDSKKISTPLLEQDYENTILQFKPRDIDSNRTIDSSISKPHDKNSTLDKSKLNKPTPESILPNTKNITEETTRNTSNIIDTTLNTIPNDVNAQQEKHIKNNPMDKFIEQIKKTNGKEGKELFPKKP